MGTAEQIRKRLKLVSQAQIAAEIVRRELEDGKAGHYYSRLAVQYLDDTAEELLSAYGQAVLADHLNGEMDVIGAPAS